MPKMAEFVDTPLIAIAWLATLSLLASSCYFKNRVDASKVVNSLVVGHVLAAFFALSVWLQASTPLDTVRWLLLRVFDGSYRRLCLLLFWSLCISASLLFCALVNALFAKASTVHRKFFHLTVSLVAVSGLLYDPKFLALSAHLVLQIFIILEMLRSLRIHPWAQSLDRWFLIFLDEQDTADLVLTPIYLMAGVFLPVLLNLFPPWSVVKPVHFAGVMSVGVGDSFAAIVGSEWGRTKWPSSSNGKTLEGSLAMLVSQLLFMPLIFGRSAFNTTLVVATVATTMLEAHLREWDNILLPIAASLIFYAAEE